MSSNARNAVIHGTPRTKTFERAASSNPIFREQNSRTLLGFVARSTQKEVQKSHECRKHRATKTLIVAQAVAHEMLKLWEVQRGTKVVA